MQAEHVLHLSQHFGAEEACWAHNPKVGRWIETNKCYLYPLKSFIHGIVAVSACFYSLVHSSDCWLSGQTMHACICKSSIHRSYVLLPRCTNLPSTVQVAGSSHAVAESMKWRYIAVEMQLLSERRVHLSHSAICYLMKGQCLRASVPTRQLT